MERKELVKRAVMSVSEADVKKYKGQSWPVTIQTDDECSAKQLKNAIAEYATDCKPEDIAVMVDQTIWGSGKKGFLFTADGFYASRNILVTGPAGRPCVPYPLVYEELESVEIDGTDCRYLFLNDKSGRTQKVFGYFDTCYIANALAEILNALAAETEEAKPAEEPEEEPDQSEENVRVPEETEARMPEEEPGQSEENVRAPEETEPQTPETRFAAKKTLAEGGDAQAQFDLGLMYESGEGTTADQKEALRWYEAAANQGHSKAQNYTGVAYKKGTGTEVNVEKAVYWYKKSAMGGYAPAQRNYALALIKGEGCDADPQEALCWMERAAENGMERAQERVAQMYEEGEGCDLPEEARKKKAFCWYEKAAEQGREKAQFSCALLYYTGEGGGQDKAKALHWFKQAAEQGNAPAQMNCGVMYFNGEGCSADRREALRWFMLAGENGHADAAYRCGTMYVSGEGCNADHREALRWFEKARELGHEKAQKAYDIVCAQIREDETAGNEQGETQRQEIRQRAQKTFERMKDAAESGDMETQYELAQLYDEGLGVVGENKAEALRWYKCAASQGHADAQYRCAMMYREGDGTRPDQEKAIEWCRRSALQDHVKAQTVLGIMYYGGDRSVPENTARGVYWLEKAKDNGSREAEELWKRCFMEDAVRSTEKLVEGDAFEKDLLEEAVRKDKTALMYARRKAAERGSAAAQYWYGRMLSTGEGTGKNEKDALYWYEKAAEQGDVRAMYECGKCWQGEDGASDSGIKKDHKKAFFWYQKAAENGHGYAQRRLAQIYDQGNSMRLSGVEKNREKALHWYQKAGEQNVDGAKARYDCLMLDERPEVKTALLSRRILLCMDTAFHRTILKKTLTEYGFEEICETRDPEEIIGIWHRKKPDIMFLPLVINGSVATESIRTLQREYPDAKVILLQAMGHEKIAEDMKRNYRVIADILPIPYTKDRVMEAVMKTVMPEGQGSL